MEVSKLHLQLLATLLRRGVAIDRASSVLTVLALLLGSAACLGLEVNAWVLLVALLLLLLGLTEKYWAQRVAIDAELFELFAQRVDDFEIAGRELDTALHALGLAPALVTRSLGERSRGALALLRWQASLLAVQGLLVLLLCCVAVVRTW